MLGESSFSFAVCLRFRHQRSCDLCTWFWWDQSWRTSQQASSLYHQRDIALMERIQRLATRMVKGMRLLPYEDRLRRLNLFFLSSGAVCTKTLSSTTISSTDTLTSRKRSFSRPQRNGTYEGMTSRYVTVVSVYSGGKQPTPYCFLVRGTVSQIILSKAWVSSHMKNDFVDLISFLSSGETLVETFSSPKTFSTGDLTSCKRNFSRPQRNGTYEVITSR